MPVTGGSSGVFCQECYEEGHPAGAVFETQPQRSVSNGVLVDGAGGTGEKCSAGNQRQTDTFWDVRSGRHTNITTGATPPNGYLTGKE